MQERIAEQYSTLRPGAVPYRIVFKESAMKNDGTVFYDHEIHRYLHSIGVKNPGGEWFACSVKEVREAYIAVKTSKLNEERRTFDFKMNPEQAEAVEKTAAYFADFKKDKANNDKPPHFLWNCKMRFGKTFAAGILDMVMSGTTATLLAR